MATLSLTNSTIWVHDVDLSGYSNKITLKTSAAELDVTTFASSYHTRIGGLKAIQMNADGYWSAPAPDANVFGALGAVDRAATVSPEGLEGKVAYFFQGGHFTYDQFGGAVGSAAPFTMSMAGSNKNGIIRGQMASKSTIYSGTGYLGVAPGLLLGLCGAGKSVYGTIHVFSAGTTITLQLWSATAANMAGATGRSSPVVITTAGGTFSTLVAGPIATDTYWAWGINAITGSFTIGASLGIQ